jgi:GTPase SAR1 family protein
MITATPQTIELQTPVVRDSFLSNERFRFNIALLGERQVGKASLLARLGKRMFPADPRSPRIVLKRYRPKQSFLDVLVRVKDAVHLDSLPDSIEDAREADGIVLVFDKTNLASFRAV